MRSQSVAPVGAQRPRVLHAPKVRANAWEDVADVARAYGLVLDPWQELVLESAMGERSDGQWATPRVGVSVPRQNGKGALIEARELAGLLVFGEESIVHSAHQQATARVGFERILSYFENYDDLRKKVKRVSTALARESIELHGGQILRFPARSKATIRGFSIDLLILDEAQIFSDSALQAVQPTMAARPNPQMWLLGTPPTPLDDGDVFTRFRDSGLEAADRRLCWAEWSAAPGADLDDRESWAQANPALGIRISYEAVQDERAALSDEGFGRERLGMWDGASSEHVISPEEWRDVEDTSSMPNARFVLGLDVDPAQTRGAVAFAGLRDDDRVHVELDEQRLGTSWIPGYVAERYHKNQIAAVVIDSKSPAAPLAEELRKLKVHRLVMTDSNDMAVACGQFYQWATEDGLRHTGQPQLNASLAVARKRPLGDRWAWNRKTSDADITPIVAATLAAWGVKTNKVRGGKPDSEKRGRRVVTW